MVCGIPSPTYSARGACFLLSFSNVWVAGSQIHTILSPSSSPPGAGNESLNFQIPPGTPVAKYPSLSHSIVINYPLRCILNRFSIYRIMEYSLLLLLLFIIF